MLDKKVFEDIVSLMKLTPYQSYILDINQRKYDFRRLMKKGGLLYVPYACDDIMTLSDFLSKLIRGPKADLIGMDRVLVKGKRGIKVYPDGSYSACEKLIRYHIDMHGKRI